MFLDIKGCIAFFAQGIFETGDVLAQQAQVEQLVEQAQRRPPEMRVTAH